MDDLAPIVLCPALHERLVTTVRRRLPEKSFGYLVSEGDARTPTDFVLFEENIRNSRTWKPRFESYGRYFVEHADAGFVATPEEAWRVQKTIWARGLTEVGVFHSHLRHPANFSQVDYQLHSQRFGDLWHLIVSMRTPQLPQLRAFAVSEAGVRELPLAVQGAAPPARPADLPATERSTRDGAIARARRRLALDRTGRPSRPDTRAILAAIEGLLLTGHDGAIDELLVHGFLRGSARRYEEHVGPQLCPLPGGRLAMGSSAASARLFCGESPRHVVELSPFRIAPVPVTNELFGLFDPRRGDVPARDRRRPATDVTWFDAAVFALWMGCRLPTEAEWEFACGGGAESDWCCADERLLPRYAWYSENSGGETHPVGTREPNAFGLSDLHGNVWEWCQDGYDPDYYAASPSRDPVAPASLPEDTADDRVHRVCRGGCMHSFAEMCRTRYRFHEPAGFHATDLGFRLAASEGTAHLRGDSHG